MGSCGNAGAALGVAFLAAAGAASGAAAAQLANASAASAVMHGRVLFIAGTLGQPGDDVKKFSNHPPGVVSIRTAPAIRPAACPLTQSCGRASFGCGRRKTERGAAASAARAVTVRLDDLGDGGHATTTMGPRFTGATHLGHRARSGRNGELDMTIRDDLTVANEHKREPVGATSSVDGDSTYEHDYFSNMKSTFNSVC